MTLWFAATRICCEGVKIDVGMEMSRRDPELTVVCKSFRIPYDEIHEVTSREIYNHFFPESCSCTTEPWKHVQQLFHFHWKSWH